MYVAWDKQEMEIMRHAKKPESERFTANLISAWDDGRTGGPLLSLTSAHASRLGELQIGALRAGEASAEWDKSSRI